LKEKNKSNFNLLCSSTTQASDLQNRRDFGKLNNILQYFIETYSKGEIQVSELIKETKTIGEKVNSEFAKARPGSERDRVLRSLKYEIMNERRNMINWNYSDTFQCIFDSELKPRAYPDHSYQNDLLGEYIEMDLDEDDTRTNTRRTRGRRRGAWRDASKAMGQLFGLVEIRE